MKTRILVVDDHPVVRRGLKSLLQENDQWEVIDEAQNGQEALEKVNRLQPDVVVLDITMPIMGGIEACRQIRKSLSQPEVLMVTQHDSPQMMQEALNAGAIGYVLKSNAVRDLVAAVDAVSQHRMFLGLRPKDTKEDTKISISKVGP